jgi:hypothetical protein
VFEGRTESSAASTSGLPGGTRLRTRRRTGHTKPTAVEIVVEIKIEPKINRLVVDVQKIIGWFLFIF